ncbi:MAG: hypothetical protein QOE31_1934 [Solirubrobacteraceae bacterium]|nr:hypothetical protein [Solirubrobacteraceae bacterium]
MSIGGGAAAALIERDQQLDELYRALGAAASAEGTVVVVSGAAGIGKTTLLSAARREAEARGLRVLHARATELERSFTFGVVRSLLERPLRRAPAEQRERLFAGAAAPAAVALGIDTTPGALVEASAALLNAIYWVIADICDLGPLVLVVDDLQWADGPSLRALAYLANRIDSLALTLLVGVRDGEVCDDADALAGVRSTAIEVAVDALSVAAVDAIVASRCTVRLDEAAVVELHRATGGNPLWIAQAAAILGDQAETAGLVDGQQWSSRALSAVVRGRLERMTPAARSVAHAVAVLGDGAAPRHIAELARVDGEQVLLSAGELARAGLFDGTATIAFAHPLMRDAVLAGSGEHALSLAHQHAARILRSAGASVERIAGHILRTVPDGDARAAADLMAAAEDAMRRGSPAAAIGYLQRAAAEPPPAHLGASVAVLQGLAEFKLGRFGDAAAHLSVAAGAVDADVNLVIAHAASLAYAGRTDDILVSTLLEASTRQSAAGDQLLITATASSASWYVTPRWLPVIELPAPDTLTALTSAERAALCAHAIHLSDAGDLEDAAAIALRSLGDGRMIAAQPVLVVLAGCSLAVMLWAGRLDDFDREAAYVDALATATASSEPTYMLNNLRVARYMLSGDLPAALATYATMQRFADGVAGAANHAIAYYAIAAHLEVLLAHDGPRAADVARMAFERSTDLTAVAPLFSKWVLASRALVHLACGRAANALVDAEEHAAFVRDHGGAALPVTWHAALPLARLACGDAGGALEAAQDFVAREHTHNVPQRIATALRTLARVEPGRRVELLTEAVALHTGGNMRLEHARALVDLGVALCRNGKRTAARAALEQGADIATACHAHPLAQRAREELNILGAKPRRLAFSGVDALTASERRIADLAATGPTNREIAQQLYLTRKTVERHLSNVYRKLGISSRDDLAAILSSASTDAL